MIIADVDIWPVTDDSGRCLAEPQPVIAPRPAGIWDSNHDARLLHVECAWCGGVLVEGDRSQATSHGICPPCGDRFEAGL